MIHIERPQHPSPENLTSPGVESARQALYDYFNVRRNARSQGRFKFQESIYGIPDLRKMLAELFHGKCAYCECVISIGAEMEVDQFRPKTGAMDLTGQSDPDHYYWLAYEWENQYPSCPTCNSTKRNYFPVARGRAAPGTVGEALKKERPLLIDPCLDYPELYFEFKNGMVNARVVIDSAQAQLIRQDGISNSQRIRRAEVSIEVYGLNRMLLVAARRQAGAVTNSRLFRPHAETLELFEKSVRDILDIEEPYLGMKRQMVGEWLVRNVATRSTPRLVKDTLQELALSLDMALPFDRIGLRIKKRLITPPAMASVAEGATAPRRMPSLRNDYIASIEIRNFRAINNMRLEFATAHGERAPWKMLLGENGAGKSSVLQAVALALMGEERLEKLRQRVGLDPERVVRRGTRSGLVRINLTHSENPVVLRITKQGFKYESGAEGVNTFLNAYGTTRLLPRSGPMQTSQPFREATTGENLFNPFQPLLDVHTYLSGLKRGMEFDRMALMLKDLLNLAGDSSLIRRGGKVWVQIRQDVDPLEELGDGYQSVIVIATDIFKNYPERLYDLQQAVGIVLVDEIGTYLHPRWKMRIAKSLQTALPRVQFLVTTHDPLCTRGLGEKEIAVIDRDEETNEIVLNDDVPSTAGLRVDQLLTSDLFGLHSTMDPDVEKDFEDYYRLLARRELTSTEMAQRDALKSKVAEYDSKLGATPRDQLMYEAIDDYLARQETKDQEKTPDEREATKQRIVELWKEYDDGSAE